jgi:fructuronate reductase
VNAPKRPPIRIVHLGLGAFFRAHACTYLQDLNDQGGGGWGVLGVSLRSPAVRDAMRPADYRYTAAALTPNGMELRTINVVREVLVAPEDPAAVIAAMVDPAVSVVSLTVTEKGYCHDPATGRLNTGHAVVRADIDNPRPQSAIGFLVRALQARRAAGLTPFTVLSCDNLPNNGALTRTVTLDLARQIDPDLAAWIEVAVAFPSNMVDRIVPATTPEDIARVKRLTGQPDAAVVVHEPFSQWVIEGSFGNDRPDLASVGVQFVQDIAPFENMKLRMLNGAHSALAYLGLLAGFQTVADAVADDALAAYLRHLWHAEITPTLVAPPETDLGHYADALMIRFANSGIQHHLSQIAMDGSQKMPQRLLATISDRIAQAGEIDALLIAMAGWIAHTADLSNSDDPMAELLRKCHTNSSNETVANILLIHEIFDPKLAAQIKEPLARAFDNLRRHGVDAMLKRFEP